MSFCSISWVYLEVYLLDDGVLLLPWTAHRMDRMLQSMKKRQVRGGIGTIGGFLGQKTHGCGRASTRKEGA